MFSAFNLNLKRRTMVFLLFWVSWYTGYICCFLHLYTKIKFQCFIYLLVLPVQDKPWSIYKCWKNIYFIYIIIREFLISHLCKNLVWMYCLPFLPNFDYFSVDKLKLWSYITDATFQLIRHRVSTSRAMFLFSNKIVHMNVFILV